MKSKINFLLSMIMLIFISGCAQGGLNPEVLVKANSQVNSFLEENPNADLNLLYYSKNDSVELEEEYLMTCGRELTPKNLYRFSLIDNSTGLNILGYLDVENQVVDCLKRDSTYVEEKTQESSNKEKTQDVSNKEKTKEDDKKNHEKTNYSGKLETKKEISLGGLEISENTISILNDIETYLNSYDHKVEYELEVEVDDNNQAVFEEESEGTLSTDLTNLFSSLVSSVKEDLNNLSLNSENELSIEIKRSLINHEKEKDDSSDENLEKSKEKDDKSSHLKEDGEEEYKKTNYSGKLETKKEISLGGLEISENTISILNDIETYLNNYDYKVEYELEVEVDDNNQAVFEEESEGTLSTDLTNLFSSLVSSVKEDLDDLSLNSENELSIEIKRSLINHEKDDNSDDSKEEKEEHEKTNQTKSFQTKVEIDSEEFDLSNKSINIISNIKAKLENYNSELELSFMFEVKEGDLQEDKKLEGDITNEVSELWDELLISIKNDISSYNLSKDFEFEVEIERKISE